MMADEYIRREDAIKYAEHAYHEWNLAMAAADGKREINLVYKRQELCKAVESVFRDMPAADVAPVVRCEKCLYRSQYANEDGFYQCGMLQCADEHCALVPPNFACIAGVRRGAKMDGGNDNG